MALKNDKNLIEIYFLRHGQTDWNQEGRIQGHLDIPLNSMGREQALNLGKKISRFKFQAILSSDLARAFETATLLAKEQKLPVFTDPRLREIHLGKLQGLCRSEIIALYGESFSQKLKDSPLNDEQISLLGAETHEAVIQRVTAAILSLCMTYQSLAVVTHGGVIRRMIQHSAHAFPPATYHTVLYPFSFDHKNQIWHLKNRIPYGC